ncbi:hypothetical protein [Cupriavidus metallidurans]|uniref:hypothetical protein n=1 Tax=Cupriavidus metallidurans TaxID=119219 RepID=UPI001CC97C5C|nr:hypothetical protein [Cupriavidus metallidurans]UBM12815.1 hypothetical protein LAI70_28080 [Cupriavidus metallidurans]
MRNAALTAGACLTGGALGYAFRPPADESLVIFIALMALVFGALSFIANDQERENG